MAARNRLLLCALLAGLLGAFLGPAPAPLPPPTSVGGCPAVSSRSTDDALGGVWRPAVTAPGEAPLRTLILVYPGRLRALYPNDPQHDPLACALAALAAHPRVAGLVLDVGRDWQTMAAYAAWDADGTTEQANQVTAQIKRQVDQVWRLAPGLEYLVIVGDDRVIPFRRVPDRVPEHYPELCTEAHYAEELRIPAGTTVGRALRDNQSLTDDYYAQRRGGFGLTAPPTPGYLVPEIGVGRLVELPTTMLGVVEAFLAQDSVPVTHGAVSAAAGGLLADLAARECALMTGAGLTVDCTLMGAPWSASAFRERLLGAGVRNEILALQHHGGNRWLGADGEFVYSGELAAAEADLARAMIISTGCHTGLSVPIYAPDPSLDIPQALLGRQANLLGNTGYSVLAPEGIRWSEALVALFERALLSGAAETPGRALVLAKRSYAAAAATRGATPSDEKASVELTLYGLPMYRYLMPGEAP